MSGPYQYATTKQFAIWSTTHVPSRRSILCKVKPRANRYKVAVAAWQTTRLERHALHTENDLVLVKVVPDSSSA
jgi:hypothetical protein